MIAALLLSALLGTASPGAAPLARVDATEITRADLDERLRAAAAARRAARPRQALGELVDEALLAADARRQGLDADPQVRAELDEQRRRLALDAMIEGLTSTYVPPEATLRAMYHSTADGLRLTIVKVETEADALAVLERLRKGGDLAAEARKSLDPTTAARSGDTGLQVRAAFPAPLAEAAFRAKPGDLIGPIALPLGWAVARVVEVRVADEAGFAARREALIRHARGEMGSTAREHLLRQLQARAKVVIDEKFLATLSRRGQVTEAELEKPFATIDGKPIKYRELHPTVLNVLRIGHGGTRSHLPLAKAHVERRLLEDEATARGFDRAPSATAVLGGIERNRLAAALARRIGKAADLNDPAVRARLEALRGKSKIWIDEERLSSLEKAR